MSEEKSLLEVLLQKLPHADRICELYSNCDCGRDDCIKAVLDAISEKDKQIFDAQDAIQDRDRLIEELRSIVIAAKEMTNNIDAYDVHPNGLNMHRIDNHVRFDKAVENFLNLVELP